MKARVLVVDDESAKIKSCGRKLIGRGDLKQSVKEFEKISILAVPEENSFDKKKAASILGLSKSTLYRKMAELGIDYAAATSQ